MSEATPEKAPKRAPPEVHKVSMTDGREVEFKGKQRLDKEVLIDGARVGVRLDFRNGETRTFWAPEALIPQAAGHGLSQKLGDETAGEEKVDEMVMAVDELIDRLTNGDWSKPREGGKDSFSGASVIVKAVAEFAGKSLEEAKAYLKAKLEQLKLKDPKVTRTAMYNSFRKPGTKIAAIIKRIEEEELAGQAGDLGGEDLLAELAQPSA